MRLLLCLVPFLMFTDFYDLSVASSNGGTIHLSDYRGKKVLVVNIASASDFADQLQRLDSLANMFADQLVIIAVPSNSFGKEPLDSASLLQLQAEKKYHFLMSGKSAVSGTDQIPLITWLTKQDLNHVVDYPIETDFQKFLINADGNMVGVFSMQVDPLSDQITNAIRSN